jgi:capsular exopolysaccharide synthesis family protein
VDVYTDKGTTLRDYLRVLFRHKIGVAIVVIIAMLTVKIKLDLQQTVYTAQVKILIAARMKSEADYYTALGSRSFYTTQSEIVTSNYVVERVVEALKLYARPVEIDHAENFTTRLRSFLINFRLGKVNPEINDKIEDMSEEQKKAALFDEAVGNLKSNIFLIKPLTDDSSIFSITVTDSDPMMATLIANSVSRSYVIYDLEQQVVELRLKYGNKHPNVIQLQNYIEEFRKTLNGKPIPQMDALGPASVKIIEQAYGGMRVSGINQRRALIVVFIMSLFVGILLAFIFEFLDQTFKSPQEIERFLNIPFLGSIPKRKRKDEILISNTNPSTTDYSRSYVNLSEHLHLLMKDKKLKTLLITDAGGAAEPTAIIANLGIYSSRDAGRNVLIIDANFRSPSLSNVFGIPNNIGLSDVMEGKISIEDAVQDLESNLHILPAGKTEFNPITLLESSAMSELIKKAKEQYEVVFINCADLRNFKDAIILSSIVDGIVLVINAEKVRRQVVKNAIDPLNNKKANLIGAVLNNRKYVIPQIIYKFTKV